MVGTLTIDPALWSRLETYLLAERKFKGSKKSMWANKSRFATFCKRFSSVPFTRDNFNVYVLELKKTYAPSHVNNIIKIAKHVDKMLGFNIIQDYTLFSEKKVKEVLPLSYAQMRELAEVHINYSRDSGSINLRQKTIIYLLATTGMRSEEMLCLEWSDVHINPYYVILRDTKNGDDRVVPIPPFVYELMQKLPKDNKRVFGLSTTWQLQRDLKDRAKAINLPPEYKVYPHVFRHSFATNALVGSNKIDSAILAMIVGWRDINTAKRYLHPDLTHIENALYSSNDLWRQNQTFPNVTERLKRFVTQLVDPSKFLVTSQNDESSITIKISSKDVTSPPSLNSS